MNNEDHEKKKGKRKPQPSALNNNNPCKNNKTPQQYFKPDPIFPHYAPYFPSMQTP